MKFSDPNGEWIWIVIGAVVGGVVNWVAHGAQFNMEGLKAFGIGAAAGALAGIIGPAAFSAAGGGAAGAGGFLAGAFGAAAGAAASQAFLTAGNNIAFGDPIISFKDYIMGVAFSAVLGGTLNGISALQNGKSFWNGNLQARPIVQPITIANTGNVVNKTPAQIQSNEKLPNTSQPSTAPTTEKITITQNTDVSGYSVKGAGIVDDGGTEITAQFGKTDNQIFHTFRHTDALGLERSAVQTAIKENLPSIFSKLEYGNSLNSIINVGGQNIQYTAFKLSNGRINIGRIHGIK